MPEEHTKRRQTRTATMHLFAGLRRLILYAFYFLAEQKNPGGRFATRRNDTHKSMTKLSYARNHCPDYIVPQIYTKGKYSEKVGTPSLYITRPNWEVLAPIRQDLLFNPRPTWCPNHAPI